MKYPKTIILLISLIIFLTKNVNSIENKILLKINNEIITSIDVYNEIKYLKVINKNLKKMDDKDIYKISINSLIRAKIKEIEIYRNLNGEKINENEDYFNELISSTYKKLGFNNMDDFKDHLLKNEVTFSDFKNKLKIESLWNELIYSKFSNKIVIDHKKLKKKIQKDNDKKTKLFLLSEIVFKDLKNQSIKEKFVSIEKDISAKGFKNAVLLHSISSSVNTGGNLGWISEKSLNLKIKKEITKISIGEYTNPIVIPGGFLILKLNDLKESEQKLDINKKLNELIRQTTNQQLNELSNIYFEKIKKNMIINEI